MCASLPSGFFLLAAKKQIQAKRSTAGASGGLGKLSFLAAVQELVCQAIGRGAGVAGEEKLQRSVLHVSPSIRPAARVAEARAHPAQRIDGLPNVLLWHLATRAARRRLLVQHCSLILTAGYARALVGALFAEHQGWLGTSQA